MNVASWVSMTGAIGSRSNSVNTPKTHPGPQLDPALKAKRCLTSTPTSLSRSEPLLEGVDLFAAPPCPPAGTQTNAKSVSFAADTWER